LGYVHCSSSFEIELCSYFGLQSPKQLYSAELRLTLEEISSLYTLPERGVYAIIMSWFYATNK
jgi:hypothetical protein